MKKNIVIIGIFLLSVFGINSYTNVIAEEYEEQINYVPANPEVYGDDFVNPKVAEPIEEDRSLDESVQVGNREENFENEQLMFSALNSEVNYSFDVRMDIYDIHEYRNGTREKVLLIPVGFTDQEFDETHNKQHFEELAAKMKTYYEFNSKYEQGVSGITLDITVSDVVVSTHEMAYYGGDKDGGTDNANCFIGDLTKEAIELVEASGFDFSEYDTDKDGIIDHIFIVHAGAGQEGDTNTDLIWSHQSRVYDYFLVDGVQPDKYIMMPETGELGVFVHEFGHDLGLLDYYDTNGWIDGYSNGAGDWAIMSSGSWNAVDGMESGTSPSNLSAFSKVLLGWEEPIWVTEDTMDLELINEDGRSNIYMIFPNGNKSSDEIYLVEYRRQIGYDEGLPGEGVLVWHVDLDQYNIGHYRNEINSDETCLALEIEEADGNRDLWFLKNRGDATDGFSDEVNQYFTHVPYQFNRRNDDGNYNFVEMLNINTDGSKATMDVYVSKGAPHSNAVISSPASNEQVDERVSVTWEMVTQTEEYILQISTMENFESNIKEYIINSKSDDLVVNGSTYTYTLPELSKLDSDTVYYIRMGVINSAVDKASFNDAIMVHTYDIPDTFEVDLSFNGENANKLMGAATYMEYSIDGENYSPVTAKDMELSGEELLKLSHERDLLIRIPAQWTGDLDQIITIDLLEGSVDTSIKDTLIWNESTNSVFGLNSEYEYSVDGINFNPYEDKSIGIEETGLLYLRKKGQGKTLPGAVFTIDFIDNTGMYDGFALNSNTVLMDIEEDGSRAYILGEAKNKLYELDSVNDGVNIYDIGVDIKFLESVNDELVLISDELIDEKTVSSIYNYSKETGILVKETVLESTVVDMIAGRDTTLYLLVIKDEVTYVVDYDAGSNQVIAEYTISKDIEENPITNIDKLVFNKNSDELYLLNGSVLYKAVFTENTETAEVSLSIEKTKEFSEAVDSVVFNEENGNLWVYADENITVYNKEDVVNQKVKAKLKDMVIDGEMLGNKFYHLINDNGTFRLGYALEANELLGVSGNDDKNQLTGINENMEFSVNGGATYTQFDNNLPNLSGNTTILVRYFASGHSLHSPSLVFTFAKPEPVSEPKDNNSGGSTSVSTPSGGGFIPAPVPVAVVEEAPEPLDIKDGVAKVEMVDDEVFVNISNFEQVENEKAVIVVEMDNGEIAFDPNKILKDVNLDEFTDLVVMASPTRAGRLNELEALANTNELEGHVYDFGFILSNEDKETYVSSFSETVTITIELKDEDVADINTEKLGVYYYNESFNTWEYVGGDYDAETGLMVFETDHFSTYGVFEYNKTFDDIKEHWAKEYIEIMAAKHITNGKSDTVFDPNSNITRAEYITMIVRALELKENTMDKSIISDVSQDKWYYESVMAAAGEGLIENNVDFKPTVDITREDMMVIVANALKDNDNYHVLSQEEADRVLENFADHEQVTAENRIAVATAVQYGIINGRGQNNLATDDTATRAETTVVIKRLLDVIK